MKVEVYTKADCHLCDVAKAVVLEVQKRVPFELMEVDITQDPAVYERYRYDIPVIRIDGKMAFRHRVDAASLEERLTHR